ncbi:MAG TPA: hypothetical protein VJ461_06645 [Candidatus Nanoarchaeia archaeon]|nr:hypothetical protein [Candidatus Nanoarchaeia archaeon]
MKVHLYRHYVDFETKDGTEYREIQRLYIPNKGVLQFTDQKKIDFFTTDPIDIEIAEWVIKEGGSCRDRYMGERDIKDEEILKMIVAHQEFKKAKGTFESKAKRLTDLL